MKHMKKAVILLFLCALAFSLVVGCSTKKNGNDGASATGTQQEKSSNEKVTLRMLLPEDVSAITKDLLYFKGIEKRLNITIEPIAVPKANFQEKLNVILSSGELPDILSLYVDGRATVLKYGPQGAFLNLSQQLDQLPNMKRYLDKYSDVKPYQMLQAPDGNIYGAPTVFEFNTASAFPNIRVDLLKKYNISEPKTVDELYQAMKQLKQQNPNSYPLTHVDKGISIVKNLAPMFGTVYGIYYNYEKKQFEDGRLTNNFKDQLAWMRKLYAEKLLDPDFAAASRETFTSNMLNGKSFLFFDAVSWADNLNPEGKKSDPNFEIKTIMQPQYNGVRQKIPANGYLRSDNVFAISAKSKQKEAALKLLNWLYSEEGKIFTSYGEPGVTYDVANGEKKVLPSIKTTSNPNGTINAWTEYGLRRHGWYTVLPNIPEYFGPNTIFAFDLYEKNNMYSPQQPVVALDQKTNDEYSKIVSSVDTYLEEQMLKIILGNLPMEQWDAAVAKAKEMGIEKAIQMQQDAYAKLYK